MKNTSLFFVFIFLIFVSGCVGPNNRSPEKSNTPQNQELGKSINRNNNAENSREIEELPAASKNNVGGIQTPKKKAMMIYVPKNIEKTMPVPVIFIFDPGADGAFPIANYRSLADKFGYALVGSNLSKNGQDLSEGQAIFKQMKNDFKATQAIDEKRVYTLGFSGGARVAAFIAMNGNNIAGVIGCGAGLPNGEDNPATKFNYFGMVGNQDFNMTELIRLDINLEKAGFNNELLVFDGKHAWPAEDQMNEAFLWLETNAMKKQLAPKNEKLISETVQHFDNLITNLEKEKRIFDAAKAADRAVHFLTGLTNTNDFENRYKALSSDQQYKQQFERKVKIMQEEMGEQNNLLGSFTTMDAAWWAETVKELNKPLPDLEKQNMNRRLVAWLGLVAYLSSNNALKKGQPDVAAQFIEIYAILEPMNPEHAYLSAVLQMQLKKPDLAIGNLNQAILLGFKDIPRMAQDTAFIPLRSRNDFNKLLQGLQ